MAANRPGQPGQPPHAAMDMTLSTVQQATYPGSVSRTGLFQPPFEGRRPTLSLRLCPIVLPTLKVWSRDAPPVKHLLPVKGLSMRQSRKFLGFFPEFLLLLAIGIPAHGRPTQDRNDEKSPGSKSPSWPMGFSPSSGPAQLRAEAHALAVPTPENARKLLRTPDGRAARRRHTRRLQDGRVRPRQAPRMGLEGGSRRARGAAQLSMGRCPPSLTIQRPMSRVSFT